MRKYRNNIILGVLLFIIACKQSPNNGGSRVSKLPYYKEASFTPNWNVSEKELASYHKIPNFYLIDQNGKELTEKTFKDKIYVVDFFFTTCPGICPRMTSNMGMIQDAFLQDNEVKLLSHSVTPTLDSVPALKSYAELKGVVSGKWYLATGSRKQIYNLGRKAYFVEEDFGVKATDDDFLHTENFVLIDKNRHIRGIYNGLNKTAVNQLIADIKTLKQERY
ncbi:SCO family protein [Wenyingzhuangia sp. IMCC45574]